MDTANAKDREDELERQRLDDEKKYDSFQINLAKKMRNLFAETLPSLPHSPTTPQLPIELWLRIIKNLSKIDQVMLSIKLDGSEYGMNIIRDMARAKNIQPWQLQQQTENIEHGDMANDDHINEFLKAACNLRNNLSYNEVDLSKDGEYSFLSDTYVPIILHELRGRKIDYLDLSGRNLIPYFAAHGLYPYCAENLANIKINTLDISNCSYEYNRHTTWSAPGTLLGVQGRTEKANIQIPNHTGHIAKIIERNPKSTILDEFLNGPFGVKNPSSKIQSFVVHDSLPLVQQKFNQAIVKRENESKRTTQDNSVASKFKRDNPDKYNEDKDQVNNRHQRL